jgi:micrococcal nuclease
MWQTIQELVVAILIFFGVWTGAVPSETVVTATVATATVAYVIDGDTLALESGERVRLLGIDTPERDECYYREARAYLEAAVSGQTVRLEADVTDRDEYGRLLRHIFQSNGNGVEQHVNYELVAKGFAVVLPINPDRAYREEFQAAEVAAIAAGLGRHSACQ